MRRLIEAVAPARWGRSFRPLLGSSWASNLADGVLWVAAPLLVESLTDDALVVGLAWLLGRLPWLIFGLPAGVIADRFDRRRIVMLANFAQLLIVTVLAVGVASESVGVGFVLAASFVLGVAEVFADTTSQTLLPMVVTAEHIAPANSRLVFGFMGINQLLGPPIGALCFAIGAWVPFGAYAVIVALVVALVARIDAVRQTESGRREPMRREVAEGARWLWRHAALRTLAITIFVFNVTFGAAFAVLVVLATDRLGLDELGFGVLVTTSAIGGVVGSALYTRTQRSIGMVWIMRIGLVIETLLHLVLALSTSGSVAMVAMFAFGIHAAMWGTTSNTVRQVATPEALQGRVAAVYMVAVQGGLVIGAAVGSLLAGRVDITAPYWFGFVGSALMLATIWKTLGLLAAPAPDIEPPVEDHPRPSLA
jgi:MFS family permease